MKLIIVESPTKSKTISNFLKDDFVVESCNGHIRDLPKSRLGIKIEENFEPEYIIPLKKRKNINHLKKEVLKKEEILLATDEDREGEAIAWHLEQIFKKESPGLPIQRITFDEITEKAVKKALENPREIDLNLVNAQQARRVLDRLVGYTLSPVLWKKIARKLSAGRVQSPALRLIVEREKEREKFKSEKYYTLTAFLETQKKEKFEAELSKINNQPVEKPGLKEKKKIEEIVQDLKKAKFFVESVEKKEVLRNPLPPFSTSTMQQETNNKFGFSSKQTMMLAQRLYEKGLITYMRTDSFNLSEDFLAEASFFIERNFGKNFVEKRRYQTKMKTAQEAHEAIRPTSTSQTPEKIRKNMEKNKARLYELIFLRTLASQMVSANFENTIALIKANQYLFKSSGSTVLFAGWLSLYPEKQKQNLLPELKPQEEVSLLKTEAKEHQTEPKAQYTEATLVKTLESLGIGRPSTYVPIIETLKQRNYIIKEARNLRPTEIGILVNDLLSKHFQEIIDYQFTARMEEDLDKVASGEKDWVLVIKNFYYPFKEKVEKKEKEIKKNFVEEKTKEVCPLCGKPLMIKMSRFGKFLACSGFPACRFSKSFKNETGVKCPKCLKGEIVKKITKRGKVFYACNRWPQCDFALWDEPLNEFCPKCNSILVKTKKWKKCSSKKCEFNQVIS